MCLALTAMAQYSILNTDFEDGLPTGWVIENGAGSASWSHDASDTGNELPAKAYEGVANMLFFVDGVSAQASSKLITPKLDLTIFSAMGVGEPLLTFYYANTGRIVESESYVDTLRVYGRTEESAAWTLLKTIDTSHDLWVKDTVELRTFAANKNYQICFEAANGNGRGVMIDEVKVIATSFCATLPNIRITDKTDSTAMVSWDGSSDVIHSELKISSVPLNSMSEKGDIFDGTLSVRAYALKGLTLQKAYYVYVRNYCNYGDYSSWASMTFETDMAVNLPYEMNFEDYAGKSTSEYTDKPGVDTLNLPTSWTYWSGANLRQAFSSDYQNYPYRYYSTNKNYNPAGTTAGNTSLKMSGYWSDTYGTISSYAILPRLNVDSIQNVQITFKYRTGSYSYSTLRIGVVEDPATKESFTLVEEITPTKLGGATATWKEVKVSFANYVGKGRYIAIQQNPAAYVTQTGKGKTETVYIDNIVVDYMPECAVVNSMRCVNQTNTSVKLVWSGNAETYDVKVSSNTAATSSTTGDLFDGQVSGMSLELNNLKPGMSYKWFVKPSCGTTWSSWQGNALVYETDSMEIPYKQNFDTYNNGTTSANYAELPSGWSFGNSQGASVSYIPFMSTSQKKSAPASMYVYMSGSGTQYTYVATPCMKVPLNQLQASFQAYTDNNTYILRVGAMTDPTDAETFELIEEIPFPTKSTWQSVEVDFGAYKGKGAYIAFMAGVSSNSGKFWIDNLVVDYAPICKGIKDIVFSDFSNNGVTIDWVPRGEETEWTLHYGPKGFDMTSAGTAVTVKNKPSYKLTGLDTYTSYDVYVRAECGADGSGKWLKETFTTLTAPADPTGYSHDFSNETENGQWIAVCGSNTNKWVVGTNGPITTGNPSAYPSNNASSKPYTITKKSGQHSWYYRTFAFKPGIYKFNFDWKGFGYSTSTFLRAFVVPGDVVFEANDFTSKYGAVATKIPDGWSNLAVNRASNKEVYYVNQDSTSATGWNHGGEDFAITEEGIYHIAFLWVDGSTNSKATTCPVAIDNISIVPSTCPTPQKVHVETKCFPSSNVRLTWLGGETAEVKITKSSYTTKLDQLETLQSDDANLIASGVEVKGNTFTATGLTPQTTYYYAIRNYNATDTSEWALGSFKTISAVGIPFYETFEKFNSLSITQVHACPPWEFHAANSSSDDSYAPTLERLLDGAPKATQSTTRSGWGIKGTTTNASQYTCELYGNNAYAIVNASDKIGTYGGLRAYMYSPLFIADKDYSLRYDIVLVNGAVKNSCSKNILEDIDPATIYALIISRDGGNTWKKEDTRLWVSNPQDYQNQGYKAVNNIADIANRGEAIFYNHMFSLDEYAGDTLQVGFYVYAGDENGSTGAERLTVDNFYVGPKPCEQPSVTDFVVKNTDDGAILTWKQAEKETEWRVKVFTRFKQDVEDNEYVVLDTTVRDNPRLEIKGLEPGHMYAAYLQAICDITNEVAGLSPWVGPKDVQPHCARSYTLPYVETFDNYALGDEHKQWKGVEHPCLIERYSNYGSSDRLRIHGTNDHTQQVEWGTALHFETPVNGWISASLPKMPHRVDSLMVTFYAMAEQEAASMEVGVSYQAEFLPFKQIDLKAKEWTKVVIPFDDYKGTPIIEVNEDGGMDTTYLWGDEITLRVTYTDECTDVYVDDVTVDLIKGHLAPSTFEADSVSTDYVRYHWSVRKGENKYHLKVYDNLQDALRMSTGTIVDEVLTNNVYSVKNLAADQALYAYVGVVNDENTVAWSDMLMVRTSCLGAFPIPYRENFNSWKHLKSSSCWTMLTNTVTSEFYQFFKPRANVSVIDEFDGQYLEAACEQDEQGGQWQYYVLPKMDAAIQTLQMSFMIYTADVNTDGPTVGVMTDPMDTTTFVPVANITAMTGRWINKTVTFANYQGQDGYIAFRQYYPIRVRIDDVLVTTAGCIAPSYGSIVKPTENSLTVKWYAESAAASYDVMCCGVGVDTVMVNGVTTTRTDVTGLQPRTNYTVYVRSASNENQKSEWVKIGERYTTAVPVRMPYANDFAQESENSQWTTAYVQSENVGLNQWIIGTSAAADTCLYISSNGSDYDYSNVGTQTYMYRPFYLSDGLHQLTLDWKCPAGASNSYARVYVVSSQQDLHHIKPGVEQGYAEEALSDGWVMNLSENEMRKAQSSWTSSTFSFTVPQEGVYFVAFMWFNMDGVTVSKSPIAINNLAMEHLTCVQPDNVVANAMSNGTEVSMSWVNGNAWDLKVSSKQITTTDLEDATYVADIYDGHITSKPYVVGGLKPSTEYFYAIRTVCADTITAWTLGSLSTSYAPLTLPFVETFKQFGTSQSVLNLPQWTHYSAFLENVYEGEVMTPSSTPVWGRRDSACTMQDPHARLEISSRATGVMLDNGQDELKHTSAWMVTPNLIIPEGQAQLTFDLGLTQAQFSRERLEFKDLCTDVTTDYVDDDVFAVLVSTDNGNTWSEKNAVVWNDKYGDYAYSSLTAEPQKQTVDLSAYAGQIIKVAFVGESTAANAIRVVHLDNVRISQTIKVDIADTTCAGYAYRQNGFDIPAVEVIPQTEPKVYTRMVTNELVADTLYTLSLMVGQASNDTIRATICGGEVYEQFGFRESKAGTYRNMSTSVLGCDSVVVLVLEVSSSYLFEDSLTICASQIPYTWHEQSIELAGDYTATYETMNGCDSVYKLHLDVVENYQPILDIELCQGDTYTLGSQVITESGTYAEPFKSVEGCDSVVTVNVTVHPTYNIVKEIDICAGSSYEIDGQTYTQAGLYPVYYTTVNGCDSVITYKLSVHEKMYTMVTDTIQEGEVYNGYGFSNLTEEGIYKDTLQAAGGCDSIVVLTLVVDMVDALYNPQTTTLTLTPNPVKKGGVVTVQQDFNANKVKVEVFSPIGMKMSEQSLDFANVEEIQLSGFNVSGTYLVRITTDEGDVYMAKLIVQ